MVGQRLGQALVECGMFHIDHHAADIIVGNLFSQAMGFILGR